VFDLAARPIVVKDKTSIRDGGRHLVPIGWFEVKTQAERGSLRDDSKLRITTPANEAAPPLAAGCCSFIQT
jgi:hypothetical protein